MSTSTIHAISVFGLAAAQQFSMHEITMPPVPQHTAESQSYDEFSQYFGTEERTLPFLAWACVLRFLSEPNTRVLGGKMLFIA
jgi:hypothetical protein